MTGSRKKSNQYKGKGKCFLEQAGFWSTLKKKVCYKKKRTEHFLTNYN